MSGSQAGVPLGKRRRDEVELDPELEPDHQESLNKSEDSSKPKRITACLYCRRQKLKCDGAIGQTCTRCKDDGMECVVRPRSNAAVLASDLRWQQTVETRFKDMRDQLNSLQAAHDDLQNRLESQKIFNNVEPAWAPSTQSFNPRSTPAEVFPGSLDALRGALGPPVAELQGNAPLDVSVAEAALLWEYFYDTLAIYHGFVAGLSVDSPSPLLLAAIATAAAKRSTGELALHQAAWLQLFERALIRLLSDTSEKTWDDAVGLCIARTWFWKADVTTSGLILGTYMATLAPNTVDVRSRRVWDFLQITALSQAALHLEPPILPEQAPPGVPSRTPTHVLFGALAELFDIVGVMTRSLTSGVGLVQSLLKGNELSGSVSYAETAVLRNCRSDIERWGAKWLAAVHGLFALVYQVWLPNDGLGTDGARLPGGRPKTFLLNLIAVYFRSVSLLVDGYLQQTPSGDISRYHATARELLVLVVDTWADSLHFWPMLLLHSALIAAIILPSDGEVSLLLC
ncbi:hypothetical protein BCR39DRAFT_513110 [Naematelia encephala]|uniref:Zn(2)-C6 fungal-type domain-containing protein n=1 Tax=Naematelia encephala TaxID=71784 RepID=A0A1Y2BMD1_9TREE|nr:hypothetical protein BCR39DRAFT_513110 [Naematelia encephala]